MSPHDNHSALTDVFLTNVKISFFKIILINFIFFSMSSPFVKNKYRFAATYVQILKKGLTSRNNAVLHYDIGSRGCSNTKFVFFFPQR